MTPSSRPERLEKVAGMILSERVVLVDTRNKEAFHSFLSLLYLSGPTQDGFRIFVDIVTLPIAIQEYFTGEGQSSRQLNSAYLGVTTIQRSCVMV